MLFRTGLAKRVRMLTVPSAAPKRQPSEAQPKPHIYTFEATGLLVIALLILIITLARHWHHIPWSAR